MSLASALLAEHCDGFNFCRSPSIWIHDRREKGAQVRRRYPSLPINFFQNNLSQSVSLADKIKRRQQDRWRRFYSTLRVLPSELSILFTNVRPGGTSNYPTFLPTSNIITLFQSPSRTRDTSKTCSMISPTGTVCNYIRKTLAAH